ncbi:MAG TPA: D-alanyl-D-alanine carboxypeptidase/D-alanyl-D-alanine-endopeptidase [Segeticoccus sp.]|uniref:D-alanyl-D-alanine carboxypeptidase/D-alanyl-D-alanine endopeptidase n=1 Tax=Segeticoccus sp. TaxID=2706531 RepID=UPI002D7FD466|nr:D-alanyl-D-alanine carboxypeptidase/D-alanyl-D-alanine-endopeptidase [Segeticoccus sp.]HET8599060.1 D-alanyl-D-alanine carboxypeptidase/D-alanyl-D-alanine-endopeptidase [Segeticoccus sp.]
MRRLPVVLTVVLVLVLALAGYATLDIYDKVPGILTRASAAPSADARAGRSAPAPGQRVVHGPVPDVAGAPALVPADGPGEAATAAPIPTTAGLRHALGAELRDPRLGGLVGATIRDGVTGRHLLDVRANRPMTPASNTKLLTAAAVSSALDLARTLDTTVVRGRGAHDIVLVSGGDTLLAPGRSDPSSVVGHAGLATLAGQVANALHDKGIGSVRLQLDDSFADGAPYAPGWDPAVIAHGYVGPVTTLGLARDRADDVHAAPKDTAMSAARVFVTQLARHHIRVRGEVTRARAPQGAPTLGAVRSARLEDVLAYALQQSDNALTEELARIAAVHAGRPATFGATAQWVQQTVHRLGIDTRGVHLVDSCGLSDGTRIPPRVIGDVLGLALDGHEPAFRDVVAKLPVAGLNGTLDDRFRLPGGADAAGTARAKTGSLPGVSALAGTVVDHDGRLLVFALIANKSANPIETRAALDRVVGTLSDCGCRR